MAFTARHYNEVARIIKNAREDMRDDAIEDAALARGVVGNIQADLRRMFAADNPRFDGTRFDMACESKATKCPVCGDSACETKSQRCGLW